MTQDKSGTITLIFSRGPNLLSRLIRWWTHSEWSHIAIKTSHGVYEAQAEGFVYHPVGTWSKDPALTYEVIEIDVPDLKASQAWLISKVGSKYDYIGILSYVIPVFRQLPSNLYCSEAARLCLKEGGVPMLDEKLHPGALRWYLKGLLEPDRVNASGDV